LLSSANADDYLLAAMVALLVDSTPVAMTPSIFTNTPSSSLLLLSNGQSNVLDGL
jgi:hypothetical protein